MVYLTRLLTGETAPELDGRRVLRVSFQQAPAHPVDDLVITASRDDGSDPLELEVAVRRKPPFTTSDKDTERLFGKLLASFRLASDSNAARRVAICVAGPQPAARQVEELARLARYQATASGFFSLIRTPRQHRPEIRKRLEHLVNLVKASLSAAREHSSDDAVEAVTWQLLGRLDILMPRLEAPDEADWYDLLNRLEPWAREQSVLAAMALRDRLESLAASYAPAAADVDLATLRRDAHELLHVERRRRAAAWTELRRLDADARGAVRSTLGVGSAPDGLHLPRSGPASTVRGALRSGGGVLVSGESGVGKSALVLGELVAAAASDPAMCDVVCLNLRLLPPTMTEVRNALGAPLVELLAEMSAPTRVLVLDAADVTIERDDQLLAQLLRAARTAGVTPWVVSATDGAAAVHTVMKNNAGSFRELTIGGLEGDELEEVAKVFPLLRRLVDEPRAKELLRRPAVIDLFVRSGSHGLPLSEADAFDIVWRKLIRNEERAARGLPHARDQVMQQLALQQLRHSEAVTLSLDAAAVAGLQHDALLRPVDRWQPLPAFAHELLRTYAVARVLLSFGNPVGDLIACDAPRWALPAVRLMVQERLSAPDTLETPLAGRFAHLQSAIDRLPAAGHGDRWADLPTEAALTLSNAGAILADAWPALVAGDAAGLRRVLRVIQQRHGRTGIIDRLVAEPVVALLLERGWVAELQNQVEELLLGWLRGLAHVGEPAGHPLRIALRERLLARVATVDERLAESSRKHWRELRRELTDKKRLEQLALLGGDLGEGGEALLRRVAADAPAFLAPALEGLFTGHSLAFYDTRLLIQLVEAYYIDECDFDGYGDMGHDGIRHHQLVGLDVPLCAAYIGPFLAMFRANPRAGVACLNRLLNHAVQARAKTLRNFSTGETPEPEDLLVVELDIAGERRRYYGDQHVWLWYRGTGVGPYPCMSALQALELVCDEHLKAGVPVGALVRLLLDECENLAMPALVVGMLVRHLERAGNEIDPFLAEPVIWRLESVRVGHEYSGLAARTEGIVAPERRNWNLRDAATWLTLAAAGDRCEALKAVGRRLIARAEELEGPGAQDEPLSEELAAVHGWASIFDRGTYKLTKTDQGILIEQVAGEQVVERLASSNADLARHQEAAKFMFRYCERFDHIAKPAPVTLNELLADLSTARALANDPPAAGPGRPYDAPAAVAAAALEARFRDGIEVPEDEQIWAARLLVVLLNVLADHAAIEHDYSVFGRGADRSAARALALLWLPGAHDLRELLAAEGVDADAIARAITWIVEHGANEARLFLARSFDPLWHTPCDTTTGVCHHVESLAIIEDIARDSLIGPWNPTQQRNSRLHIEGPVAPQLQQTEHNRVDVPRLSASIRGAWAAAASSACCRAAARALLAAVLAAHRRGLRKHDHGYQHSGNDAAAAARAVLEIAATGDASLLFAHIDDLADNPRLLSELLRALIAAGEETQRRATTARDIWPAVFERVIELVASGACPRDDHDYGQTPLAAVIPKPSYESGYLHREYEGEPILWGDPIALAPQIEQWLPLAVGHPEPLDALAHLLDQIPAEQQAEVGLPWIERLVMADPKRIARRSFLLPGWLERVRPHATSQSSRASWHRIVDALTVAGDERVAALAD